MGNERWRINSQFSGLTGKELGVRLSAINMLATEFARFTGLRAETIYGYVAGKYDGKIPMAVQRCLEYAESDPIRILALPELQTLARPSIAQRRALLENERRNEDHHERAAV